MRQLVALVLAMLTFVQPCAALTPAQELVLFGAGPVLYANFAAGALGSPPMMAYTSAGGGYCWNAAGALVGPLGANTPCFDHNPATLAALGIRIEPQRTNLLANNTAQGASLGVARTISGVTAITRTASASAVILAGTTNVAVGDLVTISGATPSTYNGAWVVTAATPDVSFTVLTATSATDSASGYAVAATSPGTLPTGFQIYSGGGVALIVKNIATLNGVPIVDIQVAGATTGAYTVYALNAQITSMTTGQQYTHQLYAALVGGSLTNVSSVRTATRGSVGNNEVPMSLSATLSAQPAATYTIIGADTYAVPAIDFYYPSAGLPVNFTLRLALGKFEQSAFATSPILTYGTAVPVPADVFSPTGAAARQILSGKACVAMQVLLEGQNGGSLLEVNDGTFSNRVYENFNTASQTVGLAVIGGAQQQPYSNTGGSALTAPRTAVSAYGNGAVIEGYDGTAPVSLAQSGRPPGMTIARIGSSNLGTPALYGWIQQIMVRPSCTAAQVRRYSTAGANLQASNDNAWPMFAANANLPLLVKIASGE